MNKILDFGLNYFIGSGCSFKDYMALAGNATTGVKTEKFFRMIAGRTGDYNFVSQIPSVDSTSHAPTTKTIKSDLTVYGSLVPVTKCMEILARPCFIERLTSIAGTISVGASDTFAVTSGKEYYISFYASAAIVIGTPLSWTGVVTNDADLPLLTAFPAGFNRIRVKANAAAIVIGHHANVQDFNTSGIVCHEISNIQVSDFIAVVG